MVSSGTGDVGLPLLAGAAVASSVAMAGTTMEVVRCGEEGRIG